MRPRDIVCSCGQHRRDRGPRHLAALPPLYSLQRMEGSQLENPRQPPAPAPSSSSVEESRAQRLQRSQARFRDRGGIFVPTNRNTLADILLGRKVASPKKTLTLRGRSASLSPKKKSTGSGNARNHDDADGGGALQALRTSPRKAAQRQRQPGLESKPSVASVVSIYLVQRN
ncbi:hypothetical protein H0H92_002081 [Tricholoma furcatifolium]|nr:hypothetical protein H0H92_002081 [Tricholoma furcatifolium]